MRADHASEQGLEKGKAWAGSKSRDDTPAILPYPRDERTGSKSGKDKPARYELDESSEDRDGDKNNEKAKKAKDKGKKPKD